MKRTTVVIDCRKPFANLRLRCFWTAVARQLTALREKQVEYFLRLAEEAEPELWGPHVSEWLARLEAEHDNCRGGRRPIASPSMPPPNASTGLNARSTTWDVACTLPTPLSNRVQRDTHALELDGTLTPAGQAPVGPGSNDRSQPDPRQCARADLIRRNRLVGCPSVRAVTR